MLRTEMLQAVPLPYSLLVFHLFFFNTREAGPQFCGNPITHGQEKLPLPRRKAPEGRKYDQTIYCISQDRKSSLSCRYWFRVRAAAATFVGEDGNNLYLKVFHFDETVTVFEILEPRIVFAI